MMTEVKYTATFPVDEWDRPSGFYSLADVPVKCYKELTRNGIVTARDLKKELYEVEDTEKGWKFVVPFDKVKVLC
jgi:hypothetical protein